ncbi:hypothetical protein ACJX0J_024736, partial [Zea mays]
MGHVEALNPFLSEEQGPRAHIGQKYMWSLVRGYSTIGEGTPAIGAKGVVMKIKPLQETEEDWISYLPIVGLVYLVPAVSDASLDGLALVVDNVTIQIKDMYKAQVFYQITNVVVIFQLLHILKCALLIVLANTLSPIKRYKFYNYFGLTNGPFGFN